MLEIKKLIQQQKPLIMGILNVTPDSFSDGGCFDTIGKALAQAKKMVDRGASIIDIGGQSTGPGSTEVNASIELERIIPVIKKIRKSIDIPISVDTYQSTVAKQALQCGANIINDVTALRGDKEMVSIIAKHRCPVILMHAKDNTPRTTVNEVDYTNVTTTVKNFLVKQIQYAMQNGVQESQIVIDPGLGHFISSIGKYSYEIINKLDNIVQLGYPVLIGASRKSFLGGKIKERDDISAIISGMAAMQGASILRVHDVEKTKLFLTKNKII